jgi:hypothetical protein
MAHFGERLQEMEKRAYNLIINIYTTQKLASINGQKKEQQF